MSNSILIVDDDQELCSLLADFLVLEGFQPQAIHDGAEAVEHCRHNSYDALVLDIMLPGMQGLEVLRRLREFCDTPVLMLTARGEDTDRIVGLEMGADDYLPKPCNPRELTARLRAILRRAGPPGGERQKSELTVGEIHLDPGTRNASYAGEALTLTSAEFNVLQALMSRAGSAVDKETISQEALGRSLSAYDRSIDVHVSKIRKKLSALGAGDKQIVSVRGMGYQFAAASNGDSG